MGVEMLQSENESDGPFASIEEALVRIAAGEAVIVLDAADRENEGDIVFAAEKASPELLAFTMRYSAGVICVPMEGEELDRLELPPMCKINQDAKQTSFAVSVDARTGITTGISAADRARTINLLADPTTTAADLTRPGHVFPLRAAQGGVLERAGHTEAAVDLARLAGLRSAAVISELVNDDGTMARLDDLRELSRRFGLTMISIEDLISWRRDHDLRMEQIAGVAMPTSRGNFRALGFRDAMDSSEHIALVKGDIADGEDVLVRVHSECLTGDIFHSRRCDCGQQLDLALELIEEEGRGIILYLKGQEGRGVGLLRKLEAYALQEEGYDTVDSNVQLGLPVDSRSYGSAARMLRALRVSSIRLLTNNPAKCSGLEKFGLRVNSVVPLAIEPNSENFAYLLAKRDRLGHRLSNLPAPAHEASQLLTHGTSDECRPIVGEAAA